MSRFSILIAALGVLAVPACSRQPVPASAPANADGQFATLEREYVIYSLAQFPVVATYLGGAAFDAALADVDGKLRDHSAQALQQEDTKLGEFKSRLQALDRAALSARRQIDRDVALAQIEFLLHQHQVLRHQERALDSFVDEPFRGVDFQIQGMTSTGASTYGTDAEWERVIARTHAVAAYLSNAEKQLGAGIASGNTPDWRVLLQFGLKGTQADAEYFAKTLPDLAAANISSASRERLVQELQAAGGEAAAAYKHLHDFVAAAFFDNAAGNDVSALKPAYRADHFAFGATEYDWALRNNLRMDKTAAQLFEESWPIVEQTRAAMIALAREIASAHKWPGPAGPELARSVFNRLSQDAPRNDDEMVEAYRKTGVRLVDYGRKSGLFEVPQDYRLDVTITPPPLRAGLDGAAYYPAPPFKKTGVGRFYVTPTDNDLAQLREEHNFAALADLAAHEGFPGHDWNYKVMTQYADQISPVRWLTPGAVEDSSSMWEDSMSSEGWALYSEALLAEPQPNAPSGFYSPEERLYQLRGKLYRDLRVRIDTGIHTGRMQFEDAVTLFSEVVDFLPGSCTDTKALKLAAKHASCESARRAIGRYSRWPTQAITYRLGKDQILALRARAQEQLGDKFSAQRFHVEFMKQGTIPAGYFAEELLRALQH